jgi:hypothetical protein
MTIHEFITAAFIGSASVATGIYLGVGAFAHHVAPHFINAGVL